MTPNLNRALEAVRDYLGETWGPEDDSGTPTGDEAAAGDGEAINPDDTDTSFNGYVYDLVDAILAVYDVEGGEDGAIDFILSVADDLADSGELPPLPDDEDDEGMAVWLGKAKTIAFGNIVLKAAEEAVAE